MTPISQPIRRKPASGGMFTVQPVIAALVVGGVAAWIAILSQQRHREIQIDLARQGLEREIVGVASGLEQAINRRTVVLHGLASHLAANLGRPDLPAGFEEFASGMMRGVPGIKALQFVEDGRIKLTWPREGNEAAIGMDLLADPRPEIGAAMTRAAEGQGMVLSGPIVLYQGTVGLVARLAVHDDAGEVLGVATVVMELDPLIDEAGLARAGEWFGLQLLDHRETPLWSNLSHEALDNPVRVGVALPDRAWALTAAPIDGWAASIAPATEAYRNTAAALVLLLAGLAWLVPTWQRTRLQSQHLRELANADETFGQLFRLVPDGVLVVREADGVILEANDAYATISGRSRSELLGRTIDEVGFWSGPEAREPILSLLMAEGSVQDHPVQITRPDGSRREGMISSRLVTLDDEACCLSVVRDVQDRVELERRLADSQRLEAIGRLAGGVAHDFNNLITGIAGYATLLADELDIDDPRRADIIEIQRASGRAADLTRQLLTFARRQVVLPQLVDINRLITDAEPLLRQITGSETHVSLELSPTQVPTLVDPSQFEQVLTNLAVNAAAAMPDGGPLVISTRTSGDHVIIEVTDSGVGIPESALPHIFEPFYTTKPPGQGTGLGLATTHGIIQQAGGRIEVESRVGAGTTFRLLLPLEQGTPIPAVTEAAPAAVGMRERILVVEDELQVRDVTRRILLRFGYAVETAADGRQALDRLSSDGPPIDVVLSDLIMPGMGGWELAAQLRIRHPDTRVLLMSGYSEELIAAEQADLAFLAKPFTPRELIDALRDLQDGPVPV